MQWRRVGSLRLNFFSLWLVSPPDVQAFGEAVERNQEQRCGAREGGPQKRSGNPFHTQEVGRGDEEPFGTLPDVGAAWLVALGPDSEEREREDDRSLENKNLSQAYVGDHDGHDLVEERGLLGCFGHRNLQCSVDVSVFGLYNYTKNNNICQYLTPVELT